MKVVVKHREQSQVDAVHAFKLLCHDLNIIQHHMRARAQKFKAIALCLFLLLLPWTLGWLLQLPDWWLIQLSAPT